MLKIPTTQLFQKLNQPFTSDRLLEDSLTDTRLRGQILVRMLGISALSGVGLTIFLWALYTYSGEPLLLTATLIADITAAGYLGTLFFFQRKQHLLPATHSYALTTTFGTVTPCMITGGVSDSPYLSLVLVVPVFLFLIAGRKYGIFWSMVVVFCIAVLWIMELFGMEFPQVIPEALMAQFRFMTWLTTLCLLVLGLVIYERDSETLTRRIVAERSQLAHEASHDPLTGLSNRKLFFSRANEALDYTLDHRQKAAVIYVNLDDFKMINDGFGHDIGDEVLNAVAQRLKANVRSGDTVARLGGDEFAIVLHGIEQAEVAEFMVEKLWTVLQEPFAVGPHSLTATGSIGVAVAPDQGLDVDRLLRMADEAMYRAKGIRNEALAS
jgi:diguanylate cyclase (GGDEF)-like protein